MTSGGKAGAGYPGIQKLLDKSTMSVPASLYLNDHSTLSVPALQFFSDYSTMTVSGETYLCFKCLHAIYTVTITKNICIGLILKFWSRYVIKNCATRPDMKHLVFCCWYMYMSPPSAPLWDKFCTNKTIKHQTFMWQPLPPFLFPQKNVRAS
jgi:hypothetical protein